MTNPFVESATRKARRTVKGRPRKRLLLSSGSADAARARAAASSAESREDSASIESSGSARATGRQTDQPTRSVCVPRQIAGVGEELARGPDRAFGQIRRSRGPHANRAFAHFSRTCEKVNLASAANTLVQPQRVTDQQLWRLQWAQQRDSAAGSAIKDQWQ